MNTAATIEPPKTPGQIVPVVRRFLITEFCANDIYNGWHLYLRDSKKRHQRNADGLWGWIRWRPGRSRSHPFQAVLDELGITMKGDGTCDDDGYAEIARRHPIPRERIGGHPRGCVEIEETNNGWRIVSV